MPEKTYNRSMSYVFEWDLENRQWDCYNEEKNHFIIVARGKVLMGELLEVPLLKVSLPESLIKELNKEIRRTKNDRA